MAEPSRRSLNPSMAASGGRVSAGPGGSTTAVHFGIALPQAAGDELDLSAHIGRFARAAERLGYDGVWVRDRIQGAMPMMEPLVALTAAAMVTRRVRLGVAVILLPLRAPVELARTAASLDRLSGGRLELGVGLGLDRERVRSVGLEPALRSARLADGVEVIRALWTGEAITVEGRTLVVRNWMSKPTPAQSSPRIWFGGHHPAALHRAAVMGDGWIGAGSTSRSDFGREIAIVRGHLEALGRAESDFGLGKRLYLGIDGRRAPATPAVRAWFKDHYRDETMADRVALVGSRAAIIEGILETIALGARLVILDPVVHETRHLRELAEEVIPAVRAALAEREPLGIAETPYEQGSFAAAPRADAGKHSSV